MTTRIGDLVEYETVDVTLAGHRARRLGTHSADALTVTPTQHPDRWLLSASSKVGTLVVDDMTVLIRPKIRPENLFLLLEVGLPRHAWRREAFDYSTSADLLPSVVAFFARTLETTLGRGVIRNYRPHEERLVALRGRIDMPAQFRAAGVRVPVACRYDEYTADTDENRYLRAAVRLAMRVPKVAPEDRRRLMHQLVALEDALDVPVGADDLDRIPITRLNAHYEPALRLARLLLANLTLVDQRGQSTAASFLVDMPHLFERFVTRRLRRALSGRLDVLDQFATSLGERRQLPMRPDLVFRRRGVPVFVGDIKYKLTGDAVGRQPDYYQLLAYTTALDLPEGVLIYCLTDGGRPERRVTVRHAGKILHTLAIDLTGPPDSVDEAIRSCADWIADRARVLV